MVAALAGRALGLLPLAIDLLPTRHREDPALVRAGLRLQHRHSGGIQGHVQIPPGLGLVGVDPGDGALEVDLLPAQQPDVRFAQARGEGKPCHGAQVARQLGQQRGGLLSGQPGHALGVVQRVVCAARQQFEIADPVVCPVFVLVVQRLTMNWPRAASSAPDQ